MLCGSIAAGGAITCSRPSTPQWSTLGRYAMTYNQNYYFNQIPTANTAAGYWGYFQVGLHRCGSITTRTWLTGAHWVTDRCIETQLHPYDMQCDEVSYAPYNLDCV